MIRPRTSLPETSFGRAASEYGFDRNRVASHVGPGMAGRLCDTLRNSAVDEDKNAG